MTGPLNEDSRLAAMALECSTSGCSCLGSDEEGGRRVLEALSSGEAVILSVTLVQEAIENAVSYHDTIADEYSDGIPFTECDDKEQAPGGSCKAQEQHRMVSRLREAIGEHAL